MTNKSVSIDINKTRIRFDEKYPHGLNMCITRKSSIKNQF